MKIVFKGSKNSWKNINKFAKFNKSFSVPLSKRTLSNYATPISFINTNNATKSLITKRNYSDDPQTLAKMEGLSTKSNTSNMSEYVVTKVDQIVNWARTGSMW